MVVLANYLNHFICTKTGCEHNSNAANNTMCVLSMALESGRS